MALIQGSVGRLVLGRKLGRKLGRERLGVRAAKLQSCKAAKA
tara:strand:- start:546 stop:671 length:126 start_codon:yes stop_codon:yes gene_type:complete